MKRSLSGLFPSIEDVRADRDTWRIEYQKLLKAYDTDVEYKNKTISAHEETIRNRNNEVSNLRSLEIHLKQTIHSEHQERQKLEATIQDLRKELQGFELTADRLRASLDDAGNLRRVTEARVSDLQDALRIERQRFDSSIARERDVDDGMRARIGLIPKVGPSESAGIQAVSRGRQSWSSTQAELENADRKKQAEKTPENDAKAAHWTDKIKAVEEADQKLEDAVGKSDDTAKN